ncbi:MAG: hypothetical protein ACREMN_07060 [Gemmatimonadales bacterium]
MRSAFAVLALVATTTATVESTAQAQRAWQPEIGIQGGYSHVKPAGTGEDDAETLIMLPGGSTLTPLLSYGSLYAIIPWNNKLAVEPTLGFSQFNVFGGGGTAMRIGLRLNYALSDGLYAGGGGVLNYIESGGDNGTQLGLQLGVGYRRQLSPGLNGRIEAQWVTVNEAENVTDAFNAYSVLLGVSSRIGARPAARGRPGAARSTSLWTSALGVVGGYSRVHVVGGGGDFTALTAPGFGSSIAPTLDAFAPGPPVLFAILPIGRNIALEPGLDVTSVDGPVEGSIFAAAVGLRLNYAVTGGWYGAVGGQLTHVDAEDGVSTSVLGGSLAWGYRFTLTRNLGGRVELNYLSNPRNDDLGTATNTFSVLLGVLMPVR